MKQFKKEEIVFNEIYLQLDYSEEYNEITTNPDEPFLVKLKQVNSDFPIEYLLGVFCCKFNEDFDSYELPLYCLDEYLKLNKHDLTFDDVNNVGLDVYFRPFPIDEDLELVDIDNIELILKVNDNINFEKFEI